MTLLRCLRKSRNSCGFLRFPRSFSLRISLKNSPLPAENKEFLRIFAFSAKFYFEYFSYNSSAACGKRGILADFRVFREILFRGFLINLRRRLRKTRNSCGFMRFPRDFRLKISHKTPPPPAENAKFLRISAFSTKFYFEDIS